MTKCARCGEEVEIPKDTNICDNCTDDLRDEADAIASQLSAETEFQAQEEEYDKWQQEQWEAEQHD